MAQFPYRVSLFIVCAAADQSGNNEMTTIRQILPHLHLYNLPPGTQQYNILTSHPERDVRRKWPPYEYGLLPAQKMCIKTVSYFQN